MKKRMYYLANARMPTEKAHGYHIAQMCQAFEQNGYDLTLYLPRRINTGALKNIDIGEYYNVHVDYKITKLPCIDLLSFVPTGLGKITAWLNSLVFKLQTATFIYSFCFRVIMLSRSKLPDIIYMREVGFAKKVLKILPRRLHKKVVIDVHVLSEDKKQLEKDIAAVRDIALIVAVSEPMRMMFTKYGINENKVMVAHNGLDTEIFGKTYDKKYARDQLDLPQDKYILSYVGNFITNGKEKGIPEIIKSAKYVLARYKEVIYYFVGGPLERISVYLDLIRKSDLPEEKFFFIDRQEISKVPLWLASSDILLMPFPFNTHYAYYMCPLKMFEYMSSGRPIIATNLPSINNILKHNNNALLARPDNIEDLANMQCQLLDDPSFANMIAKQAMKDNEGNSWFGRAKYIKQHLTAAD